MQTAHATQTHLNLDHISLFAIVYYKHASGTLKNTNQSAYSFLCRSCTMAGPSGPTAPKRPFRQRKQQTRLQFSLLPSSSSPAKDQYSQSVQDRLAGVTYKGSKSLINSTDDLSPDPISLLSPEPSSPGPTQIGGMSELRLRIQEI